MNTYNYSILIALIVLMSSCKSRKAITTGEANYKLSTKQLIKENAKQTPSFKTLQAKVKIDYSSGEKSQSHPVNIRVERDKTIWLNAGVLGVTVARIMITPNKVNYYNKLTKEYFNGDFSLLSDLLGTELDFEKVQNLLFGEAIYNLKDGAYKSYVDNNVYVLSPKKQRELFEIFFLLDPSSFKVKSQQISQSQELRHLEIDYIAYQKVNSQTLPQHIKINAVEATEEAIIKLEFKNVVLNEELRFPFKIPSGYKEIKL